MEDSERAVLGAHEAQRKYYSVRNMCPGVKGFRELLFFAFEQTVGKDGSFSSRPVKFPGRVRSLTGLSLCPGCTRCLPPRRVDEVVFLA